MTSVLFLHANAEDYLADSLLHGLRSLLGADVVDVPRRDSLYAVEDQSRVYGRGFTLYGTLPEIDVWRGWAIDRALRGEFDVVVFADIWRYWGPWAQMRSRLFELKRRKVTFVAVDGHDSEVMYPHGPAYWFGARPWPLPRAHGRIAFFKRELTPLTARLRYYGLLPADLAERRLARYVKPIAFSIPEDKLATGEEPKTKLLATHVVDPEVQALVPGTATSYAFEDEADYYADLRSSRFGITTKRQGLGRDAPLRAGGGRLRAVLPRPAPQAGHVRTARARRDQLRPLHRPARAARPARGDGGRGVRRAAARGA